MFDAVRKIGQAALLVSLIGGAAACGDMARPEDIPPVTPEEAQSAPISQPTATSPADVPVEIKAVPTATALPVEIEPQPTATALPVEIVEPSSPILPTELTVEPAAPAGGVAPVSPGSEKILAIAITDLVKQTGVAADQIIVVSVDPMEWPDASLGCPQEGMMYAQVITPGFLVILEAQGQQYKYHTDQGANVVLCQK